MHTHTDNYNNFRKEPKAYNQCFHITKGTNRLWKWELCELTVLFSLFSPGIWFGILNWNNCYRMEIAPVLKSVFLTCALYLTCEPSFNIVYGKHSSLVRVRIFKVDNLPFYCYKMMSVDHFIFWWNFLLLGRNEWKKNLFCFYLDIKY